MVPPVITVPNHSEAIAQMELTFGQRNRFGMVRH
jgi:hypothetical protein